MDKNMENWKPQDMLVEMQNGATTVEKFGSSLKAKHRNYHMTHTPLLGIYPKELKTKIQTDPCIPVFTGVALITTAERQKQIQVFNNR